MSAHAPVRLGPFQLQFLLARGGQAEVWQADHVGEGRPVALKILTGDDLNRPDLVESLHAEIRAVASLDHPHVIQVYDAGVVDADAERASDGQLAEGAPWFAMELVAGGTLNHLQEPDWPVIREVLLDLLDALAHAHARGVVHRDLKTANILFHPDGRLVLSDFGMVYAMEQQDQSTPAAGGTPVWMAPEQFTGSWTDQGPWTDLYALGCLAWGLVCRRPPFRGRSWPQLMRAHLDRPLPPLEPVVQVPEAFEPWVRRMTAKVPTRRYRRAADAAWALAAMGRKLRRPRRLAEPDAGHEPATSLLPPSERTTLFLPASGSRAPERHAGPGGRELARVRVPEMPADWRRPRVHRARLLSGTGLGLWGLREVPVVGRRRERDALWAALADVHAHRTAAAVVLRGPAGTGKSRLGRWLARRAHELGVATPLRMVHNPAGGWAEGVAGMVADALRVPPDLADDALLPLLEASVGELAARTVELLRPPEEPDALRSPEDRWRLLAELLPRLAEGRPALVWIEDAQWAADGLSMVRWFLAQPAGASVLFVATARDERLDERHEERALLEVLQVERRARTLRVGPLPDADSRALIASLIGLDAALVDEVHTRAGGNPLFAVQLVGDWVDRGILEVGPEGFSLASGAHTPVPASVGVLWRERLQRLLASGPSEWETGLYVAGALGVEIRTDEWIRACAAAGFTAPMPLPLRLLAERLATSEPGTVGRRWSFVHGMLQETVVEMAAAAGELARVHAACAAMLADRGPAVAGRRGRHLSAAGRHEAAVEAFRAAAWWAHGRDAPGHRRALHGELEALQALGEPDDARLGRVYAGLARDHYLRNEPDAQERWARQALALGERIGDPQIRVDALHDLATAASTRGEQRRAIEMLEQALAVREQIGWDKAIGLTLGELASCQMAAGRNDDAVRTLRRATALGLGGAMGSWLSVLLAAALEHQGHPAEAWATLRGVRDRILDGTPMQVGQLLHVEARILLREGRARDAAERLRRVLALRDEIGLPAPAAALDLGLVLLGAGRHDEAATVLSHFDPRTSGNDFLHGLLAANALLAASREDWADVAHHLERGEQVTTEWANVGIAQVWRRTARAAADAGRDPLAERAEALAQLREEWCAAP